MTEQEENELLCERLLGWHRNKHPLQGTWEPKKHARPVYTPTFTTWAEAGMLLDAMAALDSTGDSVVSVQFRANADHIKGDGNWVASYSTYSRSRGLVLRRSTGPLAIRAAALEYVRSLK